MALRVSRAVADAADQLADFVNEMRAATSPAESEDRRPFSLPCVFPVGLSRDGLPRTGKASVERVASDHRDFIQTPYILQQHGFIRPESDATLAGLSLAYAHQARPARRSPGPAFLAAKGSSSMTLQLAATQEKSSFVTASDGHGGALFYDPPKTLGHAQTDLGFAATIPSSGAGSFASRVAQAPAIDTSWILLERGKPWRHRAKASIRRRRRTRPWPSQPSKPTLPRASRRRVSKAVSAGWMGLSLRPVRSVHLGLRPFAPDAPLTNIRIVKAAFYSTIVSITSNYLLPHQIT